MPLAYPVLVQSRRQSLWPLGLLLLVDLLVLATFAPTIADTDFPLWIRVISCLVAALALFFAGLTITRLVRRARQALNVEA